VVDGEYAFKMSVLLLGGWLVGVVEVDGEYASKMFWRVSFLFGTLVLVLGE
jgi:hypothetical protein